ncbi:MAG: outer membrane beta-barrel protein [Bacteroidetes bacterium]|nr:outer membrane beta-barrel protein [Bacteroidota bacterium]
MNLSNIRFVCLGAILGMSLLVLPLPASAGGPDRPSPSWLSADGGDVLRPERGGGDYHWYLGLDAGLTWSLFQNGPVSFYMPNPYHVGNPMTSLILPHPYPLFAVADDGSGIGLYLGVTADFPLNDVFGIVLKANYHNRAGSFSGLTDLGEIHPDTETDLTTVFDHKTDWSFDYLGFDILLRIEPFEVPLYAMIGPSFGMLLSNTAKLEQRIIEPDDIFYTEWVNGQVDIVNMHRSASAESEVGGFKESYIDLKLGLGYRIDLTPTLSLVPEASIAVPLGTFVDRVHNLNAAPGVITDDAALLDWNNSSNESIGVTNRDFNVLTSYFTLGLRWRIGS